MSGATLHRISNTGTWSSGPRSPHAAHLIPFNKWWVTSDKRQFTGTEGQHGLPFHSFGICGDLYSFFITQSRSQRLCGHSRESIVCPEDCRLGLGCSQRHNEVWLDDSFWSITFCGGLNPSGRRLADIQSTVLFSVQSLVSSALLAPHPHTHQ